MADLEYIWNQPSVRHILNQTLPQHVDEVQEFVKRNGLHHGDVLVYSEMRDRESFIIDQEPEGKVSILRNPDDSQAGYLTIPGKVLMFCKNSYEKYKSVISDSATINLHMSPHDTFLTERFGDVPDSWKFDVHFSCGELEDIYVSTNNVDWHAVNAEGEPVAAIMQRLNYKNEVQFTVPVELKGDTLEKYKSRKGMTDYAWLQALPKIPATWRIEKGQSAGGKDWQRWEWILSGTVRDQKKAIDAVEDFFNEITEGVGPVQVDPMLESLFNFLSVTASPQPLECV